MIRSTPKPGTKRIKFNYNLYKKLRSEVSVLYYVRPWEGFWCQNILPLVKKGTYRAYANRDHYKLVSDSQLYMYVPEYFLELFEDLVEC